MSPDMLMMKGIAAMLCGFLAWKLCWRGLRELYPGKASNRKGDAGVEGPRPEGSELSAQETPSRGLALVAKLPATAMVVMTGLMAGVLILAAAATLTSGEPLDVILREAQSLR